MFRFKVLMLLCILIGLASVLVSMNGCGTTTSSINGPPPPPSGKINHVVIIFQENRTPDNLFHDPVLMGRGADIASSGKTSTGQTIPLTPVPLVTEYDLGHGHGSFLSEWDNGAMDGADRVDVRCPQGSPNCAPPDPQYQYVQASDVQPYFTLAETYTFGDRMPGRFGWKAIPGEAQPSTWISRSRGRLSMSELATIPRHNLGEGSTSSGSVLIIDDEAAIRESLETLLEMEGYDVQSAATAEEGLNRIGDRPYDLVLLDLALPDRNGIDLLAELHSHDPQLAVIM